MILWKRLSQNLSRFILLNLALAVSLTAGQPAVVKIAAGGVTLPPPSFTHHVYLSMTIR